MMPTTLRMFFALSTVSRGLVDGGGTTRAIGSRAGWYDGAVVTLGAGACACAGAGVVAATGAGALGGAGTVGSGFDLGDGSGKSSGSSSTRRICVRDTRISSSDSSGVMIHSMFWLGRPAAGLGGAVLSGGADAAGGDTATGAAGTGSGAEGGADARRGPKERRLRGGR